MTAPAFIASILRGFGSLIYLFWLNTIKLPRAASGGSGASTALFWTACAAASAALSVLILSAGPKPEVKIAPPQMIEAAVTLPKIDQRIDALFAKESTIPQNDFVRNGDTLLSLFAKLGIRDDAAFEFIAKNPLAQPLLAPQAGQFFTSGISEDGTLYYLRLYMEGPHADDSKTIELVRDGMDFSIRTLPFSFETKETAASGVFSKSLYATAKEMGLPRSITEQIQNVWDGAAVNPVKNMKKGDSLRVVYEKKFADGTFVRNGRLLAVQVVRGDDVKEAFWFDEGTTGSFYMLNGQSASQTFMRVPLDVKDVSSEFSPLRRHPVTGVVRPHNGTDLRAPSGSRIFAASDGVITFVGYEKKGYGRYLKIDHGLGRTTVYAHMSKFAKGMKKGRRVEKGQVIGYVGMTGLATGPHLHYELLLNGVQINPKTADLPDTENLSAYKLAQLTAIVRPICEQFDEFARTEGRPLPSDLKKAAAEEKLRAEAEADKVSSEAEAVETVGTPDSMFAPQALPAEIPQTQAPRDPAEDESIEESLDAESEAGE